jgi:hypothetical protein
MAHQKFNYIVSPRNQDTTVKLPIVLLKNYSDVSKYQISQGSINERGLDCKLIANRNDFTCFHSPIAGSLAGSNIGIL